MAQVDSDIFDKITQIDNFLHALTQRVEQTNQILTSMYSVLYNLQPAAVQSATPVTPIQPPSPSEYIDQITHIIDRRTGEKLKVTRILLDSQLYSISPSTTIDLNNPYANAKVPKSCAILGIGLSNHTSNAVSQTTHFVIGRNDLDEAVGFGKLFSDDLSTAKLQIGNLQPTYNVPQWWDLTKTPIVFRANRDYYVQHRSNDHVGDTSYGKLTHLMAFFDEDKVS